MNYLQFHFVFAVGGCVAGCVVAVTASSVVVVVGGCVVDAIAMEMLKTVLANAVALLI
jgi:integral membrane sensor domain MASE1